MSGRGGWSAWEKALATVYGLVCVVVGVFAFIEIYFTVTHLVHPYMGDWAWIVPAAAEGLFTGFYAGWLLLDLRDSPPPAVAWLLGALLSASAAGSYWLNVYAARGVVPDIVAHLIVVTAFYGVLLFAKVLVRRLKVTLEERARALALADAQAHARDMLRSALGFWWRRRTPLLLRRQLRSGRLPAKVMEAVESAARFGGATVWEPAVEAWITSAVVLPERFSATLAAARAEASAPAPQAPPVSLPEAAPVPLAEAPAEAPREPRAAAPARPSPRPRRLAPRTASDEDLAGLLLPLLAEGRDLTPTGVIKIIREAAGGKSGIGHERAGTVLALAREQSARVVPIGERRQA